VTLKRAILAAGGNYPSAEEALRRVDAPEAPPDTDRMEQ